MQHRTQHDEDDSDEEMIDTRKSTAPVVEDRVGQTPQIVSPFRIGFAGRGMRGRGFSRGGFIG